MARILFIICSNACMKRFMVNMQWLYLAIAIVSEVIATSALKATEWLYALEPDSSCYCGVYAGILFAFSFTSFY
ncbi:hypothetical protein GGI1_03766 [Acidithiobacillus sp. GGI-221]|nr:hypothetical protein GGI1_03766 [Acidithiobacillus sp. GGI-221]